MKIKLCTIAMVTMMSSWAVAGDDNLVIDSAIGGAVGGAIGGAVGASVGGRDGAIIGSGVGAAVGTAVNTSDYDDKDHGHCRYTHDNEVHHHYHGSGFCPPGQAKKGRC